MVQTLAKEEAATQKKDPFELAFENPMGFLELQNQILKDPFLKQQYFPEGETDQVSFFDRIRADIKGDVSKLGEENFLKTVYGDENVIKRADGNFFIREEPGKTFVELNPKGFQMKDIAEVSGEAVVVTPTLFTANPWLAGLYAIGGGALLQGIAETVPGETDIEKGERLKKIAAEGVFGTAGQYGANVVIDFFSRLGVKNFIVNKALKALEKRGAAGKEFLERGQELEQKVGKLTFGELTGEAGLKAIEDFLRGYYLTRGATVDMKDAQLNTAKNAILDFIKTSYNAANDPMAKRTGVSLGANITDSFKKVLDSFVDLRQKNATKMYDEIKFVNDSTGKQVDVSTMPVIKIDQINATLKDMIKTASRNQDDTLWQSLIKWQDDINRNAKNGLLPYEIFDDQMKIFSAASYGKGSAFKNLETAAQRRPAKQIFSAFNKALDDTIESFDSGLTVSVDDAINSQVASNLRKAKDQYRADSELIDQLENSFIRDFIAPGATKSKAAVVKRFQKLQPEEIETAFQLLKANGEDLVIEDIKKSFITDVFEDSLTAIKDLDLSQMSTAEVGRVIKRVFEPNKFLDNLTQKVGDERLKVLFSDAELDRLADITEYIQRVNFNDVKPKAAILDIIISFINPKEALIRMAGLKKMTNLMFNTEGIDALKAAFKALESDKPINELYKTIGGDLLNFYLLAETEPKDYLQEYLDVASPYYQSPLEKSIPQKIQESAIERFSPEYQQEQEKTLQDLQSFNIPSPQVSRGQGADVVPPLSAPFNPQTVASLESVGMPLFNAAEGGIVDLYESKKFKRPQVVA